MHTPADGLYQTHHGQPSSANLLLGNIACQLANASAGASEGVARVLWHRGVTSNVQGPQLWDTVSDEI